MKRGNLSISRSGWLFLLSVLHSKNVQLESDSQGMAWCFSDQSANFRVLSYANQLSLKRGTKDPREGLVSQSSWGLLWVSGWRFLCLTRAGSCFYVLPASFAERVKSVSTEASLCGYGQQLHLSWGKAHSSLLPLLFHLRKEGDGWWNEVTLRSAGSFKGSVPQWLLG